MAAKRLRQQQRPGPSCGHVHSDGQSGDSTVDPCSESLFVGRDRHFGTLLGPYPWSISSLVHILDTLLGSSLVHILDTLLGPYPLYQLNPLHHLYPLYHLYPHILYTLHTLHSLLGPSLIPSLVPPWPLLGPSLVPP